MQLLIQHRIETPQVNIDNLLLLNLNHIGDILFTTPAIRALREKYPNAHISAVVLQGMEDVLKHNPCIDEVLVRRRGMVDVLKLIPKVRKNNLASVLFSFSSFQLALLGKLSGAKVRVGFDDPQVKTMLTDRVYRDKSIHRANSFLDLAKVLGAASENSKMELFVGDDERRFAEDLLKNSGISGDRPLIAISPGSSVAAKEWFPERYAALADRLKADGADVIVVGAPSERETINKVIGSASNQPVDLAGKTKIGQLAGVLERCDVVVSNDTGPMHMAVSVGTPVVAIFGPTEPKVFGPYSLESVVLRDKLPCGPCEHKPTCDNRDCLQTITVERAYEAAMQLLEARRCLK